MFRQSAGGKNKKKKVDIVALNEKIANIARATIEENRKKNQDKEKKVNAMPEFTHKQEPKNTTFQPLVLTNDMLQKQMGNKKFKLKLKRAINIDDKINEIAPWVDKKAIASRRIAERIRELRERQKESKKKEAIEAVDDNDKVVNNREKKQEQKFEENIKIFNEQISELNKRMIGKLGQAENDTENKPEETNEHYAKTGSEFTGIGFLNEKKDEKKKTQKMQKKLQKYEKKAPAPLSQIAISEIESIIEGQGKAIKQNYVEDNKITLKYRTKKLMPMADWMIKRKNINNNIPKLQLQDAVKVANIKNQTDLNDNYLKETVSIEKTSNLNLLQISNSTEQSVGNAVVMS